jgi:hypothetical protein
LIASAATEAQLPVPDPPRVQTFAEHLANLIDSFWKLPIFSFLTSPNSPPEAPSSLPVPLIATAPLPPCQVAPLAPITDPKALAFEENYRNGDTVDVSGMVPAAARGLARFEKTVDSLGGEMSVKSGYRPPAYQAHLKDVWDKWRQLRDNTLPQCQNLRAQVEQEFTGHHLLLTQTPVSVSDHTRGLAFDAAVIVPPGARLQRRRVNLDSLARLSGFLRPAVFSDPVHFKFVGFRRRG